MVTCSGIRAPKPLFLIALVVGFAVYHWGPMLYDRLSWPKAFEMEHRGSVASARENHTKGYHAGQACVAEGA